MHSWHTCGRGSSGLLRPFCVLHSGLDGIDRTFVRLDFNFAPVHRKFKLKFKLKFDQEAFHRCRYLHVIIGSLDYPLNLSGGILLDYGNLLSRGVAESLAQLDRFSSCLVRCVGHHLSIRILRGVAKERLDSFSGSLQALQAWTPAGWCRC